MDKLEALEIKISAAVKLIQQLKDKSARLSADRNQLKDENELLLNENKQVRKIIEELNTLREERKLIQQKCEKLLTQIKKMRK